MARSRAFASCFHCQGKSSANHVHISKRHSVHGVGLQDSVDEEAEAGVDGADIDGGDG